ncbi:pterocarpan synthase 1-like [Malania oleifera]|uniref:pterocarpan synthase 1-like n=1 Tax=Malania oleifera TaxID=397392 RepID=UPI0025AE0DC8|nr:pterocarpan synthase 1-like [Malania oleifera]
MVPKIANAALALSLMLLLALSTCSDAKPKFGNLKQTNMAFYMYDWETGVNITTIPVAGIANKQWGILQFGTVFAIDDILTEGSDRNSTQVGRAHGIYVNSALDGSDLHLLLSIVFTNKQFNGSTLEIQGADRFYFKHREVSVVSGTGMFRLARGYATLETLFIDIPNSNALIRWNLTVFHY